MLQLSLINKTHCLSTICLPKIRKTRENTILPLVFRGKIRFRDHFLATTFSSTATETLLGPLTVILLLYFMSFLSSTLWDSCATLSLTPITLTIGVKHFFVNDNIFESFVLLGLTIVSRDDNDEDKWFDRFDPPVFCDDDGGCEAEDPQYHLSPRQQLRLSRPVTELQRLSSSELDVSYDEWYVWIDDVDWRWRSRLPRLGTFKNSHISSDTRSLVIPFGNLSLDKKILVKLCSYV